MQKIEKVDGSKKGIATQSMLAEGLIAERKIKVRDKSRAYTKTYLVVTSAGFSYLVEKGRVELFELTPYDNFKFSLRGNMSNEHIARMLSTNDAAIPLIQCGCMTEINRLLEKNRDEFGGLPGIVHDILSEYREYGLEQGLLTESSVSVAPRFYSSLELLSLLRLDKNSASQYAFSPHVGALVTERDSFHGLSL